MKRIREKFNKKGFTLAELLIVVAIIAVLVAVSVPVFNSKLERSREAVDIANMRAAKVAAVSAYLDGDLDLDKAIYYDAEAGVIKNDDNKPNGYGQGTALDGKMEYPGYVAKGDDGDVKGKVIEITIVPANDKDDVTVTLHWV